MSAGIVLSVAIALATSGCVLVDDASRLAARFRSGKNAIQGLDDGVAALKTKPQIFDDVVPAGRITDDAVLSAPLAPHAKTLANWADDTSAALVQEGEDAGRVTREFVQDVACDVMKYYIEVGELPSVEMLAAYLIDNFGEQSFVDPANVAEDIRDMVIAMQSGQSAMTWLALQMAGCGL